MERLRWFAVGIAACLGLASPGFAQSTVYIPAVLELSGAGAVSGTNFRDGMLLAIDEINAKGGILGRKIDTPILDTQSDAGISRAQVQKVLDNNPYVILGPVFSGSVLVDMLLTQQAEIPEIVGGEFEQLKPRRGVSDGSKMDTGRWWRLPLGNSRGGHGVRGTEQRPSLHSG